MQRKYSRLVPASFILIFGTLASTAGSVRPVAERVLAQSLTADRIHLPVVARSAPLSGAPIKPDPWIPDADFVIGGPAWTVDVVEDVAFVGVGAHLMAYDIGGEDPLRLLGASPPLPGNVRDVVVRDGFAFAAVHQITDLDEAPGGLFVMDVRHPASMEVVAVREIRGGATDVSIDGDRVLAAQLSDFYVSKPSPTMLIFDASDPRRPELIAQSPPSDSGGEGEAVLSGEFVFTCDEALRVHDPSGARASGRFGLYLAPCAALARLEGDHLLVTVTDSNSPDEDTPMLRLLDVRDLAAIETIAELPLDESGDLDAHVEVSEVRIDGSDAYVAALIDRSSGRIFQFDISDPAAPRAVASWSGDGAFLSVDADGGPVVIGAATVAAGTPTDSGSAFHYEQRSVRGSRIQLLVHDSGSSFNAIAAVDGPGTLLSTVECHGSIAYVAEVQKWPSGTGRLWALRNDVDVPTVISDTELESSRGVLELGNDSSAASRSGLFLHVDGSLRWYRLVDGRLRLVSSTRIDGAVAAWDDHLYVASGSSQLNVYDVSDPESAALVASMDLPHWERRTIEYTMAQLGDRLWLSTTFKEPLAHPIIEIDISEPTSPRIVAYDEIPSEGRGVELTFLASDDEMLWLLTTEAESGPYLGPTMTAIRPPTEGSAMEISSPWEGGSASDMAVFPFTLAAVGGSAWFVSETFRHGHGTIYTVDQAAEGALRLAGARAAPAAVRSRSTESFDDLTYSRGSLSLSACGERIFGTDLEGGLYGIDPDEWLMPEPAAGRSAADIDMPDTVAAAPQHAVVQERPGVPIFLPADYADAGIPTDPSIREPAIPSVWMPDADWVLGGPAMACLERSSACRSAGRSPPKGTFSMSSGDRGHLRRSTDTGI